MRGRKPLRHFSEQGGNQATLLKFFGGTAGAGAIAFDLAPRYLTIAAQVVPEPFFSHESARFPQTTQLPALDVGRGEVDHPLGITLFPQFATVDFQAEPLHREILEIEVFRSMLDMPRGEDMGLMSENEGGIA